MNENWLHEMMMLNHLVRDHNSSTYHHELAAQANLRSQGRLRKAFRAISGIIISLLSSMQVWK